MYERRTEEQPAIPPPPIGTVKAMRPPADVRVGDFIYLDGKYQRVQDMRSAGTAAHRVLLFAGRPPWTMRRAQDTFRPASPH
ncbi:hypothetical protein GCM10010211_00170 [Streptomyces albospinus]|uniref:Uncharacterized protein n=1 Tax=Streptomyces albospinus TaxID=285515 RepID=A0ABQ2UK29_9ACTN|nr:hypothetical protein GCM10010211_00170 [Streptomyces albospinus]